MTNRRVRNVNKTLDTTQAVIALIVILTTSAGVLLTKVRPDLFPSTLPLPPEWWTIVGLVVGFYFGRNNDLRHTEPTPPAE